MAGIFFGVWLVAWISLGDACKHAHSFDFSQTDSEQRVSLSSKEAHKHEKAEARKYEEALSVFARDFSKKHPNITYSFYEINPWLVLGGSICLMVTCTVGLIAIIWFIFKRMRNATILPQRRDSLHADLRDDVPGEPIVGEGSPSNNAETSCPSSE